MAAVVMLFWLLAAVAMFLLATGLKAVEALFESLVELGVILLGYILAGGCMLLLNILVYMFTGSFWSILGYSVLLLAGIGLIISYCGPIAAAIGGLLINILVILVGIAVFLGEKAEEWLGLCLGKLSETVSVS